MSGDWIPAYVGLGSNLDDPPRQLDAAIEGLKTLPQSRFVIESHRVGSDPVGPKDQPRFLNSVAALLTQCSPKMLHQALRDLEVRLGKKPPKERFGPRSIDLDLLMYGAQTVNDVGLEVPHPRLHERAFVLYPLAEIAPDLWVPGHGRVRALRDRVGGEGLSTQ
jgi:2-amino-4-hydroxy-6-hydroxymethyldihydropteridine diphosphokinase